MDTLKVCRVCEVEKPLMDFNNDRTSKDGKDKKCRHCHSIYQKSIKARRLAHTQRRHEIEAKCHWADQDMIKQIWTESRKLTKETGIKHQVDHILPIFGTTVWGFHLETNLEIVVATENMGKGNTVDQELIEKEEKRLLDFCRNNNL